MIRKATQGDYLNLTALSIQVWLHTYATDGIRDELSKYVLSQFNPEYFQDIHESKNQEILVAIRENHMIGFMAVDFDARCGIDDFDGYEVKILYIQEHFQNQGIGTRLLNEARNEYGDRMWLTTWIHNEPGIGFYEKYGFTKIGTDYFDLLGEKHENHVFAIGL